MAEVALISLRIPEKPAVRTYLAVRAAHAADVAAALRDNGADAQEMPWSTLPGCEQPAAADMDSKPDWTALILGTRNEEQQPARP